MENNFYALLLRIVGDIASTDKVEVANETAKNLRAFIHGYLMGQGKDVNVILGVGNENRTIES
jgi:hypothetical protein